jgi:hypothetical protein
MNTDPSACERTALTAAQRRRLRRILRDFHARAFGEDHFFARERAQTGRRRNDRSRPPQRCEPRSACFPTGWRTQCELVTEPQYTSDYTSKDDG